MNSFYIAYTDGLGNNIKRENLSEFEWRYIRAVCDENGWTINWDETSKKI